MRLRPASGGYTRVSWDDVCREIAKLEVYLWPRPFSGRGEVELVDWADVPDWPIRGTQAGIETGLRIAGGRSGARWRER